MNKCKECGKETENKYFCSLGCSNIFREKEKNKIKLAEYLENPNLCKKCGEPILPKDGERLCDAKKRLCCSSKCYSHPKRNGKINKCPVCQKEIASSAKTCKIHRSKENGNRGDSRIELGNVRTKEEIFKTTNSYQSARSSIRRHAVAVFESLNIEKKCCNCGYDKHIDVSHIKPVADFDESCTLREINHPENLIGLCPNCHWEFDNGLLQLQ